MQQKNELRKKELEADEKRRNHAVEDNREHTAKKYQIFHEFSSNIKADTEQMRTKIMHIVESSEFRACIKRYQTQLKVIVFKAECF